MNYKSIFEETKAADSFQKIINQGIIDWYIGKDNRSRFALFGIVKNEPRDLSSTLVIDVFVGIRKDGRYGITYSLMDDSLLDLFIHFVEDMIVGGESIVDENKAAQYVVKRFALWQKVFSKNNGGHLSFEEIKGLIGELIFLKEYMFSKYDETSALGAWSGTEMTDQDFAIGDVWFEVKTTVSGSPTVKISSVEQLDCLNDGYLIVVTLDKTSESDSSRITINSLYKILCDSLKIEDNTEKFKNRMLAYGYVFEKYYDKIGFKYKGYDMYRVGSTFPCIRSNHIPAAASKVKYELSLSSIQEFKEENT